MGFFFRSEFEKYGVPAAEVRLQNYGGLTGWMRAHAGSSGRKSAGLLSRGRLFGSAKPPCAI